MSLHAGNGIPANHHEWLPSVLTVARRYVAAGLSILPIATDGSKAPDWRHLPQVPNDQGDLVHSWKPYEKAAPDDREIVEWYDCPNPVGIGIACGKASGNLEVIDNDDAALFPEWCELVEAHNPDLYAKLTIIRTPSGANHIPYRCDEIEGNQKLAQRLEVVPEKTKGAKPYKGDAPEFKGKWVKTEVLFETRGQGGYIVAPGSPLTVHETGNPYEFIEGDVESIPTITKDERNLLLRLARALCELPKEDERAEHKLVVPRTGDVSRPGDDYNERGDVESVLISHGWAVSHRRGSVVFFRKPGKQGRGYNATLHAVAHNVFYCFSTSAAPFEDRKGYFPFQVYALLEHNGDFKAAAKALAGQGYGATAVPAKADGLTAPSPDAIALEDFWAHSPTHTFIFVPTREPWSAVSVNSRIKPIPTGQKTKKDEDEFISASKWLDENRAVEQLTWAPGEMLIIKDRLISEGGWFKRSGAACFNLYKAPEVEEGNAADVSPWLDHISYVYPEDSDAIIRWLAHRVQKPQEKINHALVLGGGQGIGKDTLLEPVKYAVGPWNVSEIGPHHLLGRFNGFVKSVILRISEARDLGDVDRYAFYERLKVFTAAPPDVIRVDEKNAREYSVPNICGVILTTNYTDGIFLPPDDRRHYIAWSECVKEDFPERYWKGLHGWYAAGGLRNVAAYLSAYDLSQFDAKAPPKQTDAWQRVVDAGRAPEDAELADVIDLLGMPHSNSEPQRPDAFTLDQITAKVSGSFYDWLTDRRNRRTIPHRMETAGYVPVRNPDTKKGLWKIDGKRQVIYVRRELPLNERINAARRLV